MIVLDTTILIDILRGESNAINKINEMEGKGVLFTTEINVFELVSGIYHTRINIDKNLSKVFALVSRMNVLPLDRKSTLKAGEVNGLLLRQGKEIDENDCLIAGISLANGVKDIITANKKHYERIPGINVIDY